MGHGRKPSTSNTHSPNHRTSRCGGAPAPGEQAAGLRAKHAVRAAPEARRDSAAETAPGDRVVRARGSTGNTDGGTVGEQATMSTDRTRHRRDSMAGEDGCCTGGGTRYPGFPRKVT